MKIDLKLESPEPLHVQIHRRIEDMVRRGELTEGQRLPSTPELVKQWDVNYAAIQKAMSSLSAIGLLDRKPKRGTFIRSMVDKAVVGLLVGPSLLHEESHFYRTLVHALQENIEERGLRCMLYDRLSHSGPKVNETGRRLLYDIDHHLFKGLILVGCGSSTIKASLRQNDLPSTILGLPDGDATVQLDYYDFTRTAVSHLAGQGRKKIVYARTILHKGSPYIRDIEGFMDASSAGGLTVTPHSIHQAEMFTLSQFQSAERYGHRLMLDLISQWDRTGFQPDGLIVADDIVARGMALALNEKRAGASVRIEIVASTNEGTDYLYAVPVTKYQFVPREIAESLLSLLWKQILKGELPDLPVLVKGHLTPVAIPQTSPQNTRRKSLAA